VIAAKGEDGIVDILRVEDREVGIESDRLYGAPEQVAWVGNPMNKEYVFSSAFCCTLETSKVCPGYMGLI
jgi:hypothetical protein